MLVPRSPELYGYPTLYKPKITMRSIVSFWVSLLFPLRTNHNKIQSYEQTRINRSQWKLHWLLLTLKVTAAEAIETSVTNNNFSQDFNHLDDLQPTLSSLLEIVAKLSATAFVAQFCRALALDSQGYGFVSLLEAPGLHFSQLVSLC